MPEFFAVWSIARSTSPRTALNHSSSGLNAGAVPRDSGQVTALRPAPIAVHDYGDVLGKLVGVKLREQTLFLNAGWFERVRYFHAINPANPIFWRAPRGARTPKRKEDGMRTFLYSGRRHASLGAVSLKVEHAPGFKS